MINYMKKRQAIALIKEAQNYLDIGLVEIVLDRKRSIYDNELDNKDGIAYIGMKEIVQAKAWEKIPIEDVMYPVIGMFHEVCGHGGQLEYEFQKDSALSTVLALNHYACYSENYYGIEKGLPTDQYYHQPNEIASQYTAVYCGYEFLEKRFNAEEANNMICLYTNNRLQSDSEYMQSEKQYGNVKNILVDLNQAFRDNAFRHREYIKDKNQPDSLQHYASVMNSPEIIPKVTECENGMIEDYRMAAMTFWQYDRSRILQNQPALRNLNMSIQFAFQFSDTLSEEITEESNLDLQSMTNPKHPDITLSTELLSFADQFQKML